MMTLVLVVAGVLVGLVANVLVTWRAARWMGSPAGLGKAAGVEAVLFGAWAAIATAAANVPWADRAGPVVQIGQMLVEWVLQLVALWWAVRWLLRLSRAKTAGLIGVRILLSLVWVGVAVLLVKPYVFESFVVNGAAMSPTLCGRHVRALCPRCGGLLVIPLQIARGGDLRPGEEGICQQCYAIGRANVRPDERRGPDRFVVNKMERPGRWDIVAYQTEHGTILRRVAGLPGEQVYLAGGEVFVNGQKLQLPEQLAGQRYARSLAPVHYGLQERPCTLGPEEYFVLGEFSLVAQDSRFIGPVKGSDIVGVARVRYWPIRRMGLL